LLGSNENTNYKVLIKICKNSTLGTIELKKKEIHWGIIGCGNVTEVKSGPALQKANGSRLIAVMRRNADLAEDYAKRHNVAKWYEDAGQLIDDPDVDAVYIATPPSSHKEYTLKVADAGKPVYVEKPMSINYTGCLEMIKACEKMRVPLYVAYYRRALPRFLKVKNLLAEGRIGKIRFVDITLCTPPFPNDLEDEENWRVIPEIAGCGYFCDLASHTLDLLQCYLGDIIDAKGFSENQFKLYEAEDMVTATFKFESGVLGTGVWNFNAFANIDRNEIIGDKGRIVFSTFDHEPIILESGNSIQKFNIKNPKHIQQPLIQDIVNELLGEGKAPSTGYSGAKTNLVMDMILGR
jgi:predicted dehydrogenase